MGGRARNLMDHTTAPTGARPERLSVIIPVYNEAATIAPLLARVRAASTCGLDREIIIIDDGSTDGTPDFLRGLPQGDGLRVLFRERNCSASAESGQGRLQ